MKKYLFIDRDGTIIHEPESDQQVDSLEKLDFIPGAISALRMLALSGKYDLVMVTNQDGLGTESFPEDTFWPAHQKMLSVLRGEGVEFKEILIDRSFLEDQSPNRKPGTGMLADYLKENFDRDHSYVIGDRETDLQLAENIGCKGIFYHPTVHQKAALSTSDWHQVADFLLKPARKSSIERTTRETRISIRLNLDGNGTADISTGLGFFDHMLEQIAKHGGIDLNIHTEGDLNVDEHHTIEDTALALGTAFRQALGDKRGISRYGFLLPMDDSLAQVAIDFGGRPWLVWKADFHREKVGDMPTEMFYHFFKSFSDAAQCNLNISAKGDNEHHKIEAIFKAVAKSIKMAVHLNPAELGNLPSTKGLL